MNFRTILVFVVIVLVSSLLNKNKTSTKPIVKTDRPVPQKSPPADGIPDTTGNKRKGFPGGLEELFEEIKAEFDRTHGGVQKEQAHSSMEEVAEEEDSAEMEQETDPPEDILSKDNKKIKGSVYEGETGKEEGYIEFNKKSIVQAVIMSEILQKPKSLER